MSSASVSKKRQRAAVCDPVLCPLCEEHFRAPPAITAPRRLPCAHCVCAACLDVWDLCDETGCPVCAKPASTHVLDVALAAYAEEVYAGGAAEGDYPAAATTAPTDADVHALMLELAASMAAATAGVAPLLNIAATTQAAAQWLRDDAASAAARVAEDFAALHAALGVAKGDILAQLKAACAVRIKALEAKADEMTVSVAQLGTGVALGRAALRSHDVGRLPGAAQCVAGMLPLVHARHERPNLLVGAPVLVSGEAVLASIAALAPAQAGIIACEHVCSLQGAVPPETFTRLLAAAVLPGCAAAYCEAVADACEEEDSNRCSAGPATVAAVADIVAAHLADAGCLVQAFRAVRWLAGGVDATTACAQNVAAFRPEALLAGMQRHVQEEAVGRWGCAALRTLARDADARAALVAADATARVYAAMDALPQSPRVQQHGCLALAAFSVGEVAARTVATGGLQRAYAAMDGHPASAGVQKAGCCLLQVVARTKAAAGAVEHSGGVPRLLAAMKAHLPSENLQTLACSALAAIACAPEGRAVIRASGGEAVLRQVLAAHGQSDDVRKHAVRAFERIALTE